MVLVRMTITAENSEGYASPAGLVVDPVVMTVKAGELQVLLIRSGDRHSLPGGFVLPDQSPEEAVYSHLESKTGVRGIYLEQLKTYATPGRDERGWIPSIAYIGLVESSKLLAGDGEWFSEIPETAYGHDEIITDAIERIRGKVWTSNVVRPLVPEEFTLGELRRVIEAIVGTELDPSNFTRDFPNAGLVRKTGNKRRFGNGRPGAAYRFLSADPMWAPTRR